MVQKYSYSLHLNRDKIGVQPTKNTSIKVFLLNLSTAKNLIFLAFLTQKLAPSNVLNGIIFTIDEQCNLIFETAMRLHCSPIVNRILFFYLVGFHWGEIEERETGDRRNKRLLKNNKETLFKWNGKKKIEILI